MRLLGADIVFNHSECRLLSRRAIEALSEYSEVNLFLRGLVPMLGFKRGIVEYDRAARFAGETKYPLPTMLALAWQGIVSFSTTPLSIITGLGAGVSLVSLALGVWGLVMKAFTDIPIPGWTSTVVPLYFLGGVQLLSLGIIGQYIAKTYMESKRRPRYHVDLRRGAAFRDDAAASKRHDEETDASNA
jgi:hypothetical protein